VPIVRPITDMLARMFKLGIRRGNGGFNALILSVPVFAVVSAGAYAFEEQIKLMESFTGSFIMNLNAFIIPSIAYILLSGRPISKIHFSRVLTLFGIVFAVLATSAEIVQL